MTVPIWFVVAAVFLGGVLTVFTLILLLRANAVARELRALGALRELLEGKLGALHATSERLERELRDEIARSRNEAGTAAQTGRQELAASLSQFSQIVQNQMSNTAAMQDKRLDAFGQQLATLTQSNEQRLEAIRGTVEQKLDQLRNDNTSKLDQMRATVDEKLHATLEQRLGQSFKLVSERLEAVHRGLGEMQTLAAGVGDLKRVLSNVKTRGTWGEMQLEAVLEQLFTPEQFARNVATRPNGSERVDFAIRLPGHGDVPQMWLPIDAKFPREDYERLLDAQERGDSAAAEESAKAMEMRLRDEAKKIRDKYIDPPHTTDFAMLYLPIEGLYAEALRRAGLVDALQRECRVIVAGPTTLAAMLNSLQMGFRTLAIEKRSSEVWMLLGAVKNEFGKFGEVLAKTREKLEQATNTIGLAETRTRAIARRLREVEALPDAQATNLLPQLELLPEPEGEAGPAA